MRETPSAFGFSQTVGATALARAGATNPLGLTLVLAGAGNAFGLEGARNASGGSDGACDCDSKVGRAAILPVTSSASGWCSLNSRPTMKLVIPTATASALTLAKIVCPRITLFPRTQQLSPGAWQSPSCEID